MIKQSTGEFERGELEGREEGGREKKEGEERSIQQEMGGGITKKVDSSRLGYGRSSQSARHR